MLDDLLTPALPHTRRIFCNRTLNLRHVRAIGYDMDYTLIHYRTEEWERGAYDYARTKLLAEGWPVKELAFLPDLMVRGLIVDTQLGNTLKVNSFGYVKQAYHGTQAMPFERVREVYARVVVSLSDKRYNFMNTLFSLSEACLYAQLVDSLDAGALPPGLGYQDVFRKVRASIDEAHVEGQLKDEIIANPSRYVQLDPDVPMALLDQHHAGKKLLLITNSDWAYTRPMMAYIFDRYLPGEMTWRDLFDYVIVAARKPDFFARTSPLFEVVSDDGLLRPVHGMMQKGAVYCGGDATTVERTLKLTGEEILYVGDHIYGDVNVLKQVLRWRTALILQELDSDLLAQQAFARKQQALEALMADKAQLEHQICQLRLNIQRLRKGYGAPMPEDQETLAQRMNAMRSKVQALDDAARSLVEAAGRLSNVHWGPLMRAGNDKSHLARQVERYADIYMSRVGNFMAQTPFVYLRSMRGSLPHDPRGGATLEKDGV